MNSTHDHIFMGMDEYMTITGSLQKFRVFQVIDHGLFREFDMAHPQIQASTDPCCTGKVINKLWESDFGLGSDEKHTWPHTDKYLAIVEHTG